VSVFDQRQEERYSFSETIEYSLDPFSDDEIFKGIVINITKDGICLLITNPLNEGQEITIKSTIPVSSQTAVVHWIEKKDKDYYKVGLVFTKSSLFNPFNKAEDS
jgi:hypothetical protein